jgi:hypothetical protein
MRAVCRSRVGGLPLVSRNDRDISTKYRHGAAVGDLDEDVVLGRRAGRAG